MKKLYFLLLLLVCCETAQRREDNINLCVKFCKIRNTKVETMGYDVCKCYGTQSISNNNYCFFNGYNDFFHGYNASCEVLIEIDKREHE